MKKNKEKLFLLFFLLLLFQTGKIAFGKNAYMYSHLSILLSSVMIPIIIVCACLTISFLCEN